MRRRQAWFECACHPGSAIPASDFKGLRQLQETEPTAFQRGIVLYAGREVVPFGEKLWAVPLSVWWAGSGSRFGVSSGPVRQA